MCVMVKPGHPAGVPYIAMHMNGRTTSQHRSAHIWGIGGQVFARRAGGAGRESSSSSVKVQHGVSTGANVVLVSSR